MQGVPGSGKSTVAKMIRRQTAGVILSTDDFWYMITNKDGSTHQGDTYNWDTSRKAEAHRWNQQRCVEQMQAETPVIIIDNTNIQRWQAAPYITLASIFDYDVIVVSVQVSVQTAVERQKDRPADRKVPEDVIQRMHDEMEVLV